ncbi:unnamed protein product [Brachionus calyciflorus]|uniref:Uncharacterized protein n=1 Tax=Brachionus calyciflorus TaxID=104777 RepID=A0A814NK28_9BILA|nr:unnamed protein product [Brachionus calyciflorus]
MKHSESIVLLNEFCTNSSNKAMFDAILNLIPRNGSISEVDSVQTSIINTCSIDGFLLICYFLSRQSEIFKCKYSDELNNLFNSLKSISDLVCENNWNEARLEWIKFTKMKAIQKDETVVYDFFLNEFDSYYDSCASILQQYEYDNICDNLKCKLTSIKESRSAAFMLKKKRTVFLEETFKKRNISCKEVKFDIQGKFHVERNDMCNGTRALLNHRFINGTPPFLIISNGFNALNINEVPKKIIVSDMEYSLIGLTKYKNNRRHYTLVLFLEERFIEIDNLKKEIIEPIDLIEIQFKYIFYLKK